MATEAEIAVLEARIEELDSQVESLHEQVRKAQLDQWEGRIDDLEVQLHLGSMEAAERLQPLVEKLRDRWLDAKQHATGGSATAGDVIDTLRAGLEAAMKDIRDAVIDAKTTVAS